MAPSVPAPSRSPSPIHRRLSRAPPYPAPWSPASALQRERTRPAPGTSPRPSPDAPHPNPPCAAASADRDPLHLPSAIYAALFQRLLPLVATPPSHLPAL